MNANKICLSILGSSLFIVGGIGYYSTANLMSSATSTILKYIGEKPSVSPITVLSIILAIIGFILMIAALAIHNNPNESRTKNHLNEEMEAVRKLNSFIKNKTEGNQTDDEDQR